MKPVLFLVTLTLLVAAPAGAGTPLGRTQLQTPVNNCQGALPSYEGRIRKRPLALANEGDSAAFVTCALSSEEQDLGNAEVGAMLTNTGDSTVVVRCTLVDNPVYWLWHPDVNPAPGYHPMSIELAPGQSGLLFWNAAHLDVGMWSDNVNFTCTLPPRTEMAYNYRNYLLPRD